VLAVSGATELLAFAHAASCYGDWSYDRLVKELPAILLAGLSALLEKYPGDAQALRAPNRVALVGWSPAAQMFLPTVFQYRPEAHQFDTTHVSWFAAPAEAVDRRIGGITSDAHLISIANDQVRWVKESWATLPGACQFGNEPVAGGGLLLATVDLFSVSTRKIRA
jgi:hypothetical protein